MFDTDKIFKISNNKEFETVAIKVFNYQYKQNRVYRSFCDLLNISPTEVHKSEEIPFLPIKFFKSHKVLSDPNKIKKIFKSSGTTDNILSSHYVTNLNLYERSFYKTFCNFYGDIKDYTILALLPSYFENKNSSLIYMIDRLIEKTNNPNSGFYLNNLNDLKNKLNKLKNEKVILFGVTYALLDIIEKYDFKLPNTIIIETGGMKGRRKEIIRDDLHNRLNLGFGTNLIHSEYGMTELLSQAYSIKKGIFKTPPWMRVLIRDINDASCIQNLNITGGVNIIDLANINSCSFIATEDIGKKKDDKNFEILGRFDNSQIRGCNLLV
jgi:hypothetical protein